MPFKYDINKIFAELEGNFQNEKKNNNKLIKSPENAPKTNNVAPATSKTTENSHGGDEMSKEIENSPNSADDGKKSDKENKSNETKNTGKKGKGKGNGKEESDSRDEIGGNDSGAGNYSNENANKNENNNNREEDYYLTTNATNPNKNKPRTTPESLIDDIKNFFDKKEKELEEYKNNNRIEYLKKKILNIIKKIAAQYGGNDRQDGSDNYDKKRILGHIIKHQRYKIMNDKYELRDARYIQFFIDTSGVYTSGSNKMINELMPKVIALLERQGYECHIAACGNGFYERDMYDDVLYHTRKTLEEFKAGKVSKIACPTPQTAAKMANEAEFSIIVADFDGLSSICEMANLCQKDKIPYFLCTEDRFPWEDPTLHDWVNPELYEYEPKRVYDVSIDGNPTLSEYYEKCDFEYEYEDEDEYEDEYEDDEDEYKNRNYDDQ